MDKKSSMRITDVSPLPGNYIDIDTQQAYSEDHAAEQ